METMRHYQTLGEWSYQELRPFLGIAVRDQKLKTFDGEYWVKMCGTRLNCFRISPVCSGCGIVGVKFLLQTQIKNISPTAKPHLNLYAVKGEELILMTQDHIIPWCLGERRAKRKDEPDNLETKCIICNEQKGAGLPYWIGGGLL